MAFSAIEHAVDGIQRHAQEEPSGQQQKPASLPRRSAQGEPAADQQRASASRQRHLIGRCAKPVEQAGEGAQQGLETRLQAVETHRRTAKKRKNDSTGAKLAEQPAAWRRRIPVGVSHLMRWRSTRLACRAVEKFYKVSTASTRDDRTLSPASRHVPDKTSMNTVQILTGTQTAWYRGEMSRRWPSSTFHDFPHFAYQSLASPQRRIPR